MEEITFKENIRFALLKSETELREKVLSFIYNDNSKKILYKGIPKNIF